MITLENTLDKIANDLMLHKGVVINSAAMYLHNYIPDPEFGLNKPGDIDITFLRECDARNFAHYLTDVLGARTDSALRHAKTDCYDSIYGTYHYGGFHIFGDIYIGGVQIEIMADFKQKSDDKWWPLIDSLTVEDMLTENNKTIPTASGFSLLQFYRYSPRLSDPNMQHKNDRAKYLKILGRLETQNTLVRGTEYKKYFNM
jgi:hypothetical protein